MPTATLNITASNSLILTFNDTMIETTIATTDLKIKVYGDEPSYSFTYTAEYLDSITVIIYMKFYTNLKGKNSEVVNIDIFNRDPFTSANSLRGVNIETDLSGYLNKQENQSSGGILGQSAMYIFLISVFIALVSSFGGNSMEAIWGLMNTVQLIYFLSYIYVQYPSMLDEFINYLSWANGSNEFLSDFSYLIIPKKHFTQDVVNSKIGQRSFYINASDKFPVLFVIVIVFLFTFIFDK